MTFILTLVESHILLRPDFSLYRAYITLSARQHPNNRDNVLFDDAIEDTAAALFKYARRRGQEVTRTCCAYRGCVRVCPKAARSGKQGG
jgi:hypothetical protein